MIEHFWFILPDGSFTVYKNHNSNHQVLSNQDREIYSFITAILSLSKHLNAGNIEVIKTGKRNIHYLSLPSHTIAVVTPNENEEKDVRTLLKDINDYLIKNYLIDTDFKQTDDLDWYLLKTKLDEFFRQTKAFSSLWKA